MKSLRDLLYPRGIEKWDGKNLEKLKRQEVEIEGKKVLVERTYSPEYKDFVINFLTLVTFDEFDDGVNNNEEPETHEVRRFVNLVTVSREQFIDIFLDMLSPIFEKQCYWIILLNGKKIENKASGFKMKAEKEILNNIEFYYNERKYENGFPIKPTDYFTVRLYYFGHQSKDIKEFEFSAKTLIDNYKEINYRKTMQSGPVISSNSKVVLPSGVLLNSRLKIDKQENFFIDDLIIEKVFLPPLLQKFIKQTAERSFHVNIKGNAVFIDSNAVPLQIMNPYVNVINRILMDFQPQVFKRDDPLVSFLEYKPNKKNNGSKLWYSRMLSPIILKKSFAGNYSKIDYRLDLILSLKELSYKAIQDKIISLLSVPYNYLTEIEKEELETLYQQLKLVSSRKGINLNCQVCGIKTTRRLLCQTCASDPFC